MGRSIGLDVHRDFCQVAVADGGRARSAGHVKTAPAELELFAQSLAPSDLVALEVTGNAWDIARILEPHVARVLVVSPADTGVRQARAKTNRLDARALARLLWAGQLDSVWTADERIGAMRRRLSRRARLVRARSRAKNEVHAALMRCLKDRPPRTCSASRAPLADRAASPRCRARDRRRGGPPGRLPRRAERLRASGVACEDSWRS